MGTKTEDIGNAFKPGGRYMILDMGGMQRECKYAIILTADIWNILNKKKERYIEFCLKLRFFHLNIVKQCIVI